MSGVKIDLDKFDRYTWLEVPGDWAGLYLDGKLVWEGHPGDFEWPYLLGMRQSHDGEALDRVSGRMRKELT